MNHLSKVLALAAVALAGALGATTAGASAANFNVNFQVKNIDASQSMIRSGSLPSTITGLGAATAIAPGGADPSSGYAVYSDALPGLGAQKSVMLQYVNNSGGGSACTFTISVKHDTNVLPYLLHFSSDVPSRCSAPADARSSDGQFTATTYALNWSA